MAKGALVNKCESSSLAVLSVVELAGSANVAADDIGCYATRKGNVFAVLWSVTAAKDAATVEVILTDVAAARGIPVPLELEVKVSGVEFLDRCGGNSDTGGGHDEDGRNGALHLKSNARCKGIIYS